MIGNIYKKGHKRIKIEKKIAYNYYTCKEWFNGNSNIVSLTKEQILTNEFICKL